MKADSYRIARVFSSGGDAHYVLPHFQREYAWDKENWGTLLNDVLGVYEAFDPSRAENAPEHFMGALVVINDGTRNATIPAFKLVDGQQRLTTISLLLCALGRLTRESHTKIHEKIQRLLINVGEDGLLRYKLLPTTKYSDRQAYLSLIDGEQATDYQQSKIPQAFAYFHEQLETRLSRGLLDAEKLFLVITNCLQVVFIDLDQRERPYEIFESLNHKGKPLGQADLVRNYIAMKLPETRQEEAFNKYWSGIENALQESRSVSRIGEMTAFLRHYLAYKSGVLYNKDHIYARFRDRIERDTNSVDAFTAEIKVLNRFAQYYDRLLRPKNEPDTDIRLALTRLSILDLATAYPFLLAAYEGLNQNEINKEQFLLGLGILENYLVRRYLSDEPSNYLNKMFPTLWGTLDLRNFAVSLRKALLEKNYPSDNRIRQVLRTHQVYDKRNNQKINFVLEAINRELASGTGGYTTLEGEPTIEHILPQSDNEAWKKELGAGWEEAYRDYLHTLGNLTLVTQGWNSSLSNSIFSVKRQKLASHALHLNSVYFSNPLEKWDAAAIQARTEWLANKLIAIWPSFGDPPLTASYIGRKPRVLTVLGEATSVSSWREVAIKMTEYIAKLSGNDFDRVAESQSSYLSKQAFQRSQMLSTGWHINLNLTGERTVNFCSQLISAVGLTDEDWELEFDETLNGVNVL